MNRLFLGILSAICLAMPISFYALENDPDLIPLFTWLEKGEWLPFKPAVPSHFIFKPFLPTEQFGLGDGVMWTTQENVDIVWNQYRENPNGVCKLVAPLIRAQFSLDVCQTGPDTFSITEAAITETFNELDAQEINFKYLKWSGYPLLVADVVFSNRKPLAIAWVGLNQGGPTICIDYQFPDDHSSYEAEWGIWHQFLLETTGVPLESAYNSVSEFIHSLKEDSK